VKMVCKTPHLLSRKGAANSSCRKDSSSISTYFYS